MNSPAEMKIISFSTSIILMEMSCYRVVVADSETAATCAILMLSCDPNYLHREVHVVDIWRSFDGVVKYFVAKINTPYGFLS